MTDHTHDANPTEQPVRLKLTAVVHYDRHGTPTDELQRLLRSAIHHAHDNGMLTADSDAEVGGCDVRVEELGPEPATNSDLRRFADVRQAEGRLRDTSLRARSTLAREVYTTIEHGTESLEGDHLGADLAYLLGAILRGESGCEWDHDRPLVRLLREHFAGEHAVWRYVHIAAADGQDEDSRLDRARSVRF